MVFPVDLFLASNNLQVMNFINQVCLYLMPSTDFSLCFPNSCKFKFSRFCSKKFFKVTHIGCLNLPSTTFFKLDYKIYTSCNWDYLQLSPCTPYGNLTWVIRVVRLGSCIFFFLSHQSEEGDLSMGTSVGTLQIWVTFLLRLHSWYIRKLSPSPFSCVFASSAFPSLE